MTDEPINPPQPEEAMDQGSDQADHPHAGVAAESWSSPQADSTLPHECAEIVLKRGGAETDVSYPVSPPAVIGRFDPAVGPIDVDLSSVPEGAYVSRKHAAIEYEDGAWRLKDLGSSNGTFILRNDFERVEETDLSDGDEFALGNARFVFKLVEPAVSEA